MKYARVGKTAIVSIFKSFLYKTYYLLLLYVCAPLHVRLSVHIPHVFRNRSKAEESIRSPETEITDGCKKLHGF